MSADSPTREESLGWIDKAEQHLAGARILHAHQGPSGMACFMCQQAAEMSLKALLVATGVAVPRTHDLVGLFRRLPGPARPQGIDEAQLAGWTDYAIAPRYPGFGDAKADVDLPAMLGEVAHLVATARGLVERLA